VIPFYVMLAGILAARAIRLPSQLWWIGLRWWSTSERSLAG